MKLTFAIALSFALWSFALTLPTPAKQSASVPSDELLRDAQAGNPDSQYHLALRYFNGKGVTKDEREGLIWLTKAAHAGHPLSQVSLGLAYRDGFYGVAVNADTALQWIRKSADAGDAHGQSELGFMYENGIGLQTNEVEAVRLYTLAANQGLAIAQFDLAYMYASGKGTPPNPEEAIKLYEKAAIFVPTARTNLATLYFQGKGVPRDPIKAYQWGLLAVSAQFERVLTEDPPVTDNRLGHCLLNVKQIAKGMSKRDKNEGRDLATQWIKSHAAQLGREPEHFSGAIAGIK